MAQSDFTPILIYSSSTTTNAPAVGNLTNSTLGSELAINITDGKLFYKDNANAIQVIGWKVRPATAGGTGLTSFAVGDLIYADTTTTLAKLADIATGNALISGGVGVAPSYGKIGLTTHISGVLPVANGGTNASTASITSFNNITGYTASGATGTTSTNLVFSTSPSITTPTLVGDVTMSTGNLVVSTSGKGIDFSATPGTGTSELLNDYEEGTWTPAPNSGTFSSATGQYTRIGRVVTLQFNVTVGTGGGTTMTGNPFTTYGGANAVAVSSAMYTEGQTYPAGATTAQVLLGGGGSTISFVGVGSVIGFTSMTLSASAVLIGSLTFIV